MKLRMIVVGIVIALLLAGSFLPFTSVMNKKVEHKESVVGAMMFFLCGETIAVQFVGVNDGMPSLTTVSIRIADEDTRKQVEAGLDEIASHHLPINQVQLDSNCPQK